MAKLLNMKLNYKGKLLDFVREGRDIKKKFFIGSNKYLFWQILDPDFPDKHLFVTEKGNQMFMQLPPGAKLSCAKDGIAVDNTYLTQNNILNGTELQLRPDMTGTVAIAPEWEVTYEFKEPWVTVLTPEEKQIVAQYARFSEPTAMERFNRNLVLLFIFLTVVFCVIFDLALKPKESFDYSLEAKLQALQKADLVKVDEAKIVGNKFEEQQNTGNEAAEPKPAAEAVVAPTSNTRGVPGGTPGGTSTNASSMFGIGKFDPNATSSAPTIRVATLTEGFAASRPGTNRGGGGGGGQGAGGGPGGAGFTTSFDPNATPGYSSSDIGKIATNAPALGGSSIKPKAGSFVSVAGDLRKLAPSGVAFGITSGTNKQVATFQSRGIAQVTESNIQAAAPEARTRYESIGSTVKARQSQIAAIYSRYNATLPFSGSASIRLLILANGQVQSAIITPNGQMPEEFLNEVKNLCEGWSFNVNTESDYTFTARFRKG